MSDRNTEDQIAKDIKTYKIEALVLMSGNVIEVAEVLDIFQDGYRIKTPHGMIKLVFSHAIAYIDNGESHV